jgi:hypothetical protein
MENRCFLAWSTTLWLGLFDGEVLRLGLGLLLSSFLCIVWYGIHGLLASPRCPRANVGVVTVDDCKVTFGFSLAF